uniref:THAP-type domain-containing protein n=1 Tax=Astatotilapia calliptera TaxID=8154 RepID=A0A3P8NRB0_ASTCA
MVRSCCVLRCNVRSHDWQENKLEKGLSFHSFPTWKQHERLAWIGAVRRADISSLPSPNICWCSRHFHSSKFQILVLIFKKKAKISLFLYSTFEQWDSVSTYSVNANYLHGSALQA